MTNSDIYHLFFPNDNVRFKKARWIIMIIIQELSMGKYKAVLKCAWNSKYRSDIYKLCTILSKGKLYSTKGQIQLGDINFSHEINYPKWVDKLVYDYISGNFPSKRIKVFKYDGKYIVIDGNHRLKAMKIVFECTYMVDVLILSYDDPNA